MKNQELPFNFNILQAKLIELIREGVLIISHNLQPIYLNRKAEKLCQQLWNRSSYYSSQLPPILSHISHQMFRNASDEGISFVIDFQINEKQAMRIRACRLTQALDKEFVIPSQDYQYILVFLEDRNDALEDEMRIEQQKYNFTERETEIFRFLSQAYTYQEIAQTLQVSLNTVKFHAKNIYSKKRGYLEKGKITFLEIKNNKNTTQKCGVHSIKRRLKQNKEIA